MKRNRLLISIFSVVLLSVVFVSVYAANTNANGNANSNKANNNTGSGTAQVQTQVQNQGNATAATTTTTNQTQAAIKSQINISSKTSYDDRKKEVQAKIALKKNTKDQNTELKGMINDNIHTINSLRQTLRSKLVAMLQTLEQYKNLTALTAEQSADIDKKMEIVTQVRTVLQTQNGQYKTSISNFRQDTSIDKITSLTDIVTAQATRIDILNATIALF